MKLIDTNVLLDLVTNDARWSAWSEARLEAAALAGGLVINDIVYAELSIRYRRIEALDEMPDRAAIAAVSIPRAALFLAGKAFQLDRAAGGVRTGALPDFVIGAHAMVEGWPLLTRDARRFRGNFPQISLIAPTA